MTTQFTEQVMVIGSGGGRVVVAGNAAQVQPRTRFEAANSKGKAFVWASLDKNPAAGDTILGLENNDLTEALFIEKIVMSSDTATIAHVFGASGVTMAGTTTIVGNPLNRKFNTVPNATCVTDETGNGEAAGSWATGFGNVAVVADDPLTIDVKGAIRLGNDDMIGVDFTALCGAANVTIWGWYE
jgi:hypothetical protein